MALKKLLIKFIDLILYGNFWIAFAALAMALQSQYILSGQLIFSALNYFIFSSTLLLYALHRIVGLQKVKAFQDQGRYFVISKFRSHILFYAFISGIFCIYFFFQLSIGLQISIIIPALISIGYVLPLLGKNRRLRDFNHIKIYLIMLSWAWITVILPWQELQLEDVYIYPMAIERALFIFAITLPFDIRDLKIDTHTEVKTLPAKLGIKKSIFLSQGSLFAALLLALYSLKIGVYSPTVFLALLLTYLSTAVLIGYSGRFKHDYYFTGLMDGTMILQFLLVYFIA